MVQGRSRTFIIVGSTTLAIALITVLLRCYVRLYLVKAFRWEDWLMVSAMVLFTGMEVCAIIGGVEGLGQRAEYFETRPGQFRRAMMLWWLNQFFYGPTIMATKVSILGTLYRIAVEKVYKWIIYITGVLAITTGLFFFFFHLTLCRPPSDYWNFTPQNPASPGSCVGTANMHRIVYAYSAGEAMTDLAIGLVPWFLIQNLQVNRKLKVMLAVVLGFGCTAGVIVLIRIPYVAIWNGKDVLYSATTVWILLMVEACVGITAGSLVTLRPLLRIGQDVSSTSSDPSRPSDSQPLASPVRRKRDEEYHSFLKEQAGPSREVSSPQV